MNNQFDSIVYKREADRALHIIVMYVLVYSFIIVKSYDPTEQ